MAVSGLIGAGAQDALAELFRQQLLKQQLEQRQREAEQEAALRQQQLTQQGEQNQFMRDWRTEEQAQSRAQMQAEAQQAAGAAGARQNADLMLQMPGLTEEQKQNELQGLFTRTGDKTFIELAKLRQTPDPKYTAPLRLADGTVRQFEEGKIPEGTQFYREPDAGPRETRQWLVRNGQVVYAVPEPGDTPHDRTRTNVRPVSTTHASELSDINNSLQMLGGLKEAIGQTGAASSVGAMLPNAISEMTGWGIEAKQRQALIDQVKQIIGKALEGGVLRKEDEAKYAKILPTIGDPPEVASAKIDGLARTLSEKRSALIDTLDAAGFNVSGFGGGARAADPLGIRRPR